MSDTLAGGVLAMRCPALNFASKPKLSKGDTKRTCSQKDARVMVVSEQRCRNCVVYFYMDREAAEKDAGKWWITSRIMFEITDPSKVTELHRWGPPMAYNNSSCCSTISGRLPSSQMVRQMPRGCGGFHDNHDAMLPQSHLPSLSHVCKICC